MVTLKIIKTFFDNYTFDKNVLKLDECTTITDVKKYVKTNINYLEKNTGNKRFLPYFDRLKRVYLKIKKDEKTIN